MRGTNFCPLMEKTVITFLVTDFIDNSNLLLVNSCNFRMKFFDLFLFLLQNGTSVKTKCFCSWVKFERGGERVYLVS